MSALALEHAATRIDAMGHRGGGQTERPVASGRLPPGLRPTVAIGLGALLFGGWQALRSGRVLDRGGDVASAVPFGPGHDALVDYLEALQSPYALPVSGGVFLVSLLLLLAGGLLLARRPSARWWAQQALLAGLLIFTLKTLLELTHALGDAEVIVARLQTFLDVAGGPIDASASFRGQLLQLVVFRGVLLALLAGMLWRVTRPDVARWLRVPER